MKEWKQKSNANNFKRKFVFCRLPSKDKVHAAEKDLSQPFWWILNGNKGTIMRFCCVNWLFCLISCLSQATEGWAKLALRVTLRCWPAQGNVQGAKAVWLTLALPNWPSWALESESGKWRCSLRSQNWSESRQFIRISRLKKGSLYF